MKADPIDLGSLNHLTPAETKKIQENQLIVAGLYEQSPQGKSLYHQQAAAAKANIEHSEKLEKQVQTVAGLREKLASLETSLDFKYSDWLQAEAEMTSALRPYTAHGVRTDLERLAKESSNALDALSDSFMRDTSELPTFLKEYEEQAVLKHLRRLKAESI